ncbi:DUF2497 domain-containing protein [Rhizosaccharibacter radicis]|uniref:DUF2497 domain-containing protein n=1 Tax=Rhizosaccharibacter radicis TaxID=2782605 RepID=A0ABT1VW87_9PROT|nr:DUF2497 domain-containing protein [Acetobacteraceae bacterium KSS12]
MDEILASIRRILHEEEPRPGAAPVPDREDDLLVLDRSMMVSPPKPEPTPVLQDEIDRMLFGEPDAAPSAPPPKAAHNPPPAAMLEPVAPTPVAPLGAPVAGESLLADESRVAAERAFSRLRDAAEPVPAASSPAVWRGGPTLEDMVRDELRGQLKLWLDENLPGMVEKLVRQEIERLSRG